MDKKNGIKLLVEVVMIGVNPFNKQQMVDILLQDIHILSGMVIMMYG